MSWRRGRSKNCARRQETEGHADFRGVLSPRVTYELVLLYESTATETTGKGPLARVDPFMLDAVIFTLKAAATVRTRVWPERLLVL